MRKAMILECGHVRYYAEKPAEVAAISWCDSCKAYKKVVDVR